MRQAAIIVVLLEAVRAGVLLVRVVLVVVDVVAAVGAVGVQVIVQVIVTQLVQRKIWLK